MLQPQDYKEKSLVIKIFTNWITKWLYLRAYDADFGVVNCRYSHFYALYLKQVSSFYERNSDYPVAFRMAKTLQSFGHLECYRVKD